MSRLRYIGSKARIAEKILDVVGLPTSGAFFDVFSGTGVVSREAARRGWRIKANDHLVSSSIITAAKLLSATDVPFKPFGGYDRILRELNNASPIAGFITREYSPSGLSKSGHSRKYFTIDNAKKIDGMRSMICRWGEQGLLTDKERVLLLADLLEAANHVANIAGTYGCFLNYWSQPSSREICVQRRELLPRSTEMQVFNSDVFALRAQVEDTVYLDPPYTKRQYAAYYHLLETIAVGDSPQVSGVTGLRPWHDKSSPFCFKKFALHALLSLCRRLEAKRCFVSYSSEGHIFLNDLTEGLRQIGRVKVHDLGSIGRYRPNKIATDNGSQVDEFLISCEVAPHTKPTSESVETGKFLLKL